MPRLLWGLASCGFSAVACAAAIGHIRDAAVASPLRECTYGPWSAPTVIEPPIAMLNATRFPVIATVTGAGHTRPSSQQPGLISDVVGVAGYEAIDPWPEASWPGAWPPQLRVFRARQNVSVPPPNGAHWYAYPRAATDRHGVLHVVWAEPDTAPPVSRRDVRRGVMGEDPRFTAVWYAQLRDGEWSQPSVVFRAYNVKWHRQVASQLVIESGARLRIAFPADDSTGSSLVYLHAESSSRAPEWHSRVWRFQGGVGYADLGAGEDGRLAIAVVKAPEPPETGRDFLYVTYSADSGSTWSSPKRISRPTEEPAREPHVFLRDTVVNVVWTSQPYGSFTDGVVWNANVRPQGVDVRQRTALRLSGATNGSRVAVDPCGTVHFVVRQYSPSARASIIAYARHGKAGWSAIEHPFELPGHQPSIAVVRDTVRLIWSSLDQQSSPPKATLMTATLPVTFEAVSP